MFKEADYDKILLIPPIAGMNQNISEQILPTKFSYYLLNILPTPLGKGTVRYGDKLIFEDEDLTYRIIRAFPFQNTNGNRQIIRYGQQFKTYVGATSKIISDVNKITIEGGNTDVFVKDSYLLLQYDFDGIAYPPSYYFIQNVTEVEDGIEIEVEGNSFPGPVPAEGYPIVSLSYASGVLDVYDIATGTLVDGQRIEDLAVACIPRGEFIDSIYFICNGVDKIMTWDGTTLKVYTEFVKEFANTFNRIDNTHFSFISNNQFIIGKYFNGNLINIKVDGVTSTLTVSNIGIVGNVITITTQENLPEFGAQARVELFYQDSPPPFSFLKAAKDRLFALGPGAAGIEYRIPFDALRFYATYTKSTDINGFRFISEVTKTVPSTDISGKHGTSDNLEAIAVYGSNMVFMGRHKSQVWQGDDPTTSQLPTSLFHVATLPEGIAHGDLLIELPNDISFISPTGNVSFSTLNIAKQMAATSFNAIDPLIRQHLKDISASNLAYRACRSFKYSSGTFAGFKIGFNDVLVSKYETQLYGWSVFSGHFTKAFDFVSDSGSSLFLFIDGKIFQYADGVNSEIIYGDNDGNDPIDFAITWPVNNKKRWCNKRYEIQFDYSSSVFSDKRNYVNIYISGDLSKTFSLQNTYTFDFKGDVLGSVNLSTDNIKGLSLDTPYAFHKDRLHFIGLNFFVSIIGQAVDGPISFKQLRLFGISER
jgi:hypothetical protein